MKKLKEELVANLWLLAGGSSIYAGTMRTHSNPGDSMILIIMAGILKYAIFLMGIIFIGRGIKELFKEEESQ